MEQLKPRHTFIYAPHNKIATKLCDAQFKAAPDLEREDENRNTDYQIRTIKESHRDGSRCGDRRRGRERWADEPGAKKISACFGTATVREAAIATGLAVGPGAHLSLAKCDQADSCMVPARFPLRFLRSYGAQIAADHWSLLAFLKRGRASCPHHIKLVVSASSEALDRNRPMTVHQNSLSRLARGEASLDSRLHPSRTEFTVGTGQKKSGPRQRPR